MATATASSGAGNPPAAGAREIFDVAVVGAGPAGAATARWLALHGRRVALIERTRFDTPRVGESLAPAVQPLLVDLGVWQDFLGLQPLPSFGTRSHWGGETPRVHSHVMNPWGSGWHVDRLAFDRLLAAQACRAGAVPFFGMGLFAGVESPAGWRLTLRVGAPDPADGRGLEVSARLLIDATGRSARCASQAGAWRLPLDHLVGVAVRYGGVDASRERFVLVEATADGWWYSAPIPGSGVGGGAGLMAMLMTDGDLCRRLHLSRAGAWSSRLPSAPVTGTRLATAHPVTAPRIYSAASHRLRRPRAPSRWLAVGDAALAVDPISGSGVVRALRTARAGAEAALEALASDSFEAIARYEADRDRECSRYLEERAMYYALERRWPAETFWARRAAAVSSYRAAD